MKTRANFHAGSTRNCCQTDSRMISGRVSLGDPCAMVTPTRSLRRLTPVAGSGRELSLRSKWCGYRGEVPGLFQMVVALPSQRWYLCPRALELGVPAWRSKVVCVATICFCPCRLLARTLDSQSKKDGS